MGVKLQRALEVVVANPESGTAFRRSQPGWHVGMYEGEIFIYSDGTAIGPFIPTVDDVRARDWVHER